MKESFENNVCLSSTVLMLNTILVLFRQTVDHTPLTEKEFKQTPGRVEHYLPSLVIITRELKKVEYIWQGMNLFPILDLAWV